MGTARQDSAALEDSRTALHSGGKAGLKAWRRQRDEPGLGQRLELKLMTAPRAGLCLSLPSPFPYPFLQDQKTLYPQILNIPSFVWCSF